MRYRLLSVSADSKTRKGEKSGYLTGILYLAPSNQSGRINVCKHATKGCRAACLYTAGRGNMPTVKQARINRTIKFVDDEQFARNIYFDICQIALEAEYQEKIPAIRLNGTSDIDWAEVKYKGKTFFEHFPNIQFYNYTKDYNRMTKYLNGELAPNYHLTFSRAETKKNQKQSAETLSKGGNVAIVFRKVLPETYMGYPVINGDINDLRFLDEKNVVVGLLAKGKAKKDTSGFVVDQPMKCQSGG